MPGAIIKKELLYLEAGMTEIVLKDKNKFIKSVRKKKSKVSLEKELTQEKHWG